MTTPKLNPAERPIIFSPEMVRAIMADPPRKTQTRRVAKLTAAGHVKEPGGHRRWHPDDPEASAACPYGNPGDVLYVKETFYVDLLPWANGGSIAVRPGDLDDRDIYYRADGECCDQIPECCCGEVGPTRWRPSMFMPRWASRLLLRVESVRVERLQEISEEDAKAEGVEPVMAYRGWSTDGAMPRGISHVDAFEELWDSLQAKRPKAKRVPWEANPWVFVIDFRRING